MTALGSSSVIRRCLFNVRITPESGRGTDISGRATKTCHGPLPRACESDVALPRSCQRDVPRSYFCGGSGDAVGRHRTQAFKFAVYQYSHRAFASDLARVKVLDQGIGTP
jgi:hypothetical protein